MRICQLQKIKKTNLLALFFMAHLFGCSQTTVLEKKDSRQIVARWHNIPLRFSNLDDKDRPVIHPFFDVSPQISQMSSVSKNNKPIRYVVTTPEGSNFQYELDLYSGKLYRERVYCAQDDIWESYRADLSTPNFTQGIVPRVLDENNRPMKIVVISPKESIEPFKLDPLYFDEAKVLGSVILESCENYPCDKSNKWKATQILFGVSAREVGALEKNIFSDLKMKIDWSYLKGILTNMKGYHRLGGKTYPAYRISKELNLADTYAYFQKTATVYDEKKMSDLFSTRESCMKLYDDIWNEVTKIHALKTGQADQFLTFFKQFYSKSSDQYYACQKIVRPANIVENNKRLWFFSYIHAFTLLEKNGFFYSCSDNSWSYNPRVDDKKYFIDQNKELARCKSKKFEMAFDQAINGMSLMKNQINRSFRFIEYDSRTGGSHQKIYGWIDTSVQNYACKNESKQPTQIPFEVFPQDVVWENFRQEETGIVR